MELYKVKTIISFDSSCLPSAPGVLWDFYWKLGDKTTRYSCNKIDSNPDFFCRQPIRRPSHIHSQTMITIHLPIANQSVKSKKVQITLSFTHPIMLEKAGFGLSKFNFEETLGVNFLTFLCINALFSEGNRQANLFFSLLII